MQIVLGEELGKVVYQENTNLKVYQQTSIFQKFNGQWEVRNEDDRYGDFYTYNEEPISLNSEDTVHLTDISINSLSRILEQGVSVQVWTVEWNKDTPFYKKLRFFQGDSV